MLEWDVWLAASVLTKSGIYLTSFFAAGSLLVLWLLKPSLVAGTKQHLQLTIWAILGSAVLTVLRIAVQAGQIYDEGWSGLFNIEMISIIAEGPLGPSSYVRLAGLALLLSAVWLGVARSPMTIAGAVLIAVSFSIIGHATKDQVILGSLIVLHLLAVSYWLGALYPLHVMADERDNLVQTGEIAHKFGKQAAFIVPVLIIAGVAFAINLVGSPLNLIGTDYGLLLLFKIVMVAGLLALAALNKFRLVPTLMQGNQASAKRLQTSIKLEFIAFLIIFALTAMLTTAVNLPET